MIRQAMTAVALFFMSTAPAAAIPMGIRTGWNETLSLWLGFFCFMAATSGLALHAAKPPQIAFHKVHTAEISRLAKVYRAIFDITTTGCMLIVVFGPYAMGEWKVDRTEDIEGGILQVLEGGHVSDQHPPAATPSYN